MSHFFSLVTISIVSSLLFASPSLAKNEKRESIPAQYSIVHAIPSGFGADLVDVYVNSRLAIDNAAPGNVRTFTAARGTYLVEFFSNGIVPGPGATPLLSASSLNLGRNSNFSIVAHLNESEKPVITIFNNMITGGGVKRSWLTVRHVAAAPAVQVQINSEDVFSSLGNAVERKRTFSPRTYQIQALQSDTRVPLSQVISVSMSKNRNTVVYIWGAKSKGNLLVLEDDSPKRI